jgi:hypothetical protein
MGNLKISNIFGDYYGGVTYGGGTYHLRAHLE